MIDFISKFFKNIKEEKYQQENIEMFNFYMMRKQDVIVDFQKKKGYFPVCGTEYKGMMETGMWNGLKVHYRCINVKTTGQEIDQLDYIIHSVDGLPPIGGLSFREFMDAYGHLASKITKK